MPAPSGSHAYENPHMDKKDMDAAMERRMSVNSAQDPDSQIDSTMAKAGGKATSISDNIKQLKEQPVTSDDGNPWYIAPLVVFFFIFFDMAKIIGEKQAMHGTTVTGSPLQWTICLLNMIVAFAMICAFRGKAGVQEALDWNKLKGYIMPSIFFASGQLFNLLQNLYIEGGTRKVFAQLRIPLTAFFARFVMGTSYSPLQWVMILSLCVSVFQFSMMTSNEANAFSGSNMMIGLFMSVLSNLSAVLGSLAGEKTMKEAKKLPFYLQKFQFEVWTFTFAVIAGFTVAPLGAALADLVSNGWAFPRGPVSSAVGWASVTEGKEFTSTWITTYRAAHWGYNDALMKDYNWSAEYATIDNLNNSKAAVPVDFANMLDLKGWNKDASEVADADSYMGVDKNDARFNGLEGIVNKLYDVRLRRGAKFDGDLKDFVARENFIDAEKYGPSGKIGQVTPAEWRKVDDLMLSTKFFIAKPMTGNTPKASATNIRDSFVFWYGKTENEKYTSHNIQQRAAPGEMHADAMKRSEFDSNLFFNAVAAAKEKNGSYSLELKPAEYFTLTVASGSLKHNKQGNDLFRTTKAPGQLTIFNYDGQYTEKYVYKKLFKYDEEKQEYTLSYFRDHIMTGSVLPKTTDGAKLDTNKDEDVQEKELDMESGIAVSPEFVMTKTVTESQLLQITLVCKEQSSFKEVGQFSSNDINDDNLKRDKKCTVEDIVRKSMPAEGKVEQGKKTDLATKVANDKKKAADKTASMNGFRAAHDKEQMEAAVKAALGKLLDPYTGEGTMYTEQDKELDRDNSVTKFGLNRKQFNNAINKDTDSVVYTYPGTFAAGVAGDDKNPSGCDRVCQKLYNKPDAYKASTGKGGAPWFKSDGNNQDQYNEMHPYTFSERHGYTRWPFNACFLSAALFFAIFCNAGQQWLSAYISKVLSSLWKNICAAVSLALVIWVEKLFFTSEYDQARAPWDKYAFATAGVMLTVFVFQLAPKPAKKEEETPVVKGEKV